LLCGEATSEGLNVSSDDCFLNVGVGERLPTLVAVGEWLPLHSEPSLPLLKRPISCQDFAGEALRAYRDDDEAGDLLPDMAGLPFLNEAPGLLGGEPELIRGNVAGTARSLPGERGLRFNVQSMSATPRESQSFQ
jgi:hypothetical protein